MDLQQLSELPGAIVLDGLDFLLHRRSPRRVLFNLRKCCQFTFSRGEMKFVLHASRLSTLSPGKNKLWEELVLRRQ